MQDEHGTYRQLPWREWFPWLCLFRTFRLAIDFRKLLLAAVGLIATALGWWLFAVVLLDAEDVRWHDPFVHHAYSYSYFAADTTPTADSAQSVTTTARLMRDWPVLNPVLSAWSRLTDPFWRMFDHRLSWAGFTFYLLCGVWAAAVWGLAGAAITRIAAFELALEERSSLRGALGFGLRRWVSYFWAPLFPLVGVLLAVLAMSLLGWLLRFDLGLLLMGIIWPLYLLAGLFMVIVLLGLLFGWPLMWATISVEGTDMFDALSRTYSYVYQRPLHYIFYVVVAAIYGMLGWLLVAGVATAVVYLSFWGASWTAGSERVDDLLAVMPASSVEMNPDSIRGIPSDDAFDGIGLTGVRLLGFWVGCVGLLVLAFSYSYFWTAATAIYLLMRRQTDATEMDELFTDAVDERHALPPLKADAAGVPLTDPAEPPATDSGSIGEGPAEPPSDDADPDRPSN